MPEHENIQNGLVMFYWKAALCLIITLLFAPVYFLILLIFYVWRERVGARLVQFYSRICLFIFRVKIEAKEEGTFKKRKGILIISNHVSFLDIFVLSSLFGSLFVSKAEVKYYPVIGQIAWLSGVLFLDRSSSVGRLRILNTIVNECADRVLAVFPQGTTSSISKRLSFQRGIFKTVELNPEISLLPVTLRYKEDDEIAWCNPQSLKENVIRVGSQEKIHVRVTTHSPITIADYEGKTTSEICEMVEKTVLLPLDGDYSSYVFK